MDREGGKVTGVAGMGQDRDVAGIGDKGWMYSRGWGQESGVTKGEPRGGDVSGAEWEAKV